MLLAVMPRCQRAPMDRWRLGRGRVVVVVVGQKSKRPALLLEAKGNEEDDVSLLLICVINVFS